ncbi:MAG: ABC transporter ATP-binding protein, partial [Endomicrobia bacterium]|nr:ABC transporter ATP-binding protein [Endomicrobiia bacterium]
LKNIYKKYNNSIDWVLKDITFSVPSETLTFICGPSGVGKSTMLHILGLMDRPNKGDVYFFSKQILFDKVDLCKLRLEYIGFVFQFHYLLEHLTVKENIFLPLWVKYGKVESNPNHDNYIYEYLELLGIKHLLSRYPHELSGGEQQRVALARALVNKPKLVIADEPTGNLDYENTKNIVSLIKSFINKYKISFVVATHNTEIIKFGDRVIFLQDGKIVEKN